MVRSMTGFGKAEFDENGIKIAVEIQSVNSRFLDLKTRLPKFLNEYENELRKITQRFIERGRISITINFDQVGSRSGNISVDYELAERYAQLSGEIASRYNIKDGLDTRSLLLMPDVLKFETESSDSEEKWNSIRNVVITAFNAHTVMREKEGEAIGGDVSMRLSVVLGIVREIEAKAPEIITENTEKLRGKIENLLLNGEFDETRFVMEIATYANRVDTTEECIRFQSHCDLFLKEITGKKTSGKKLSFLLQEMNREINTIASKASNAEISQMAVRVKEELEKMREQVENME